jgi:hypothetical protein
LAAELMEVTGLGREQVSTALRAPTLHPTHGEATIRPARADT